MGARGSPVDEETLGGRRDDEGSAITVFKFRDFLCRRPGTGRPELDWLCVCRVVLLMAGTGAEAVLFCDNGLFTRVRLPPLIPLPVLEAGVICLLIRSSTSLGLKATRARSFCTASSSANSIAQ